MLIHVFRSGAIPGSTGYFGYTLKRVPKTVPPYDADGAVEEVRRSNRGDAG